MYILENGVKRKMTAEEVAELQKECVEFEKTPETLSELKTKAVEMQSELAELIDKINRLENEGNND